jgi:hypothetical protein
MQILMETEAQVNEMRRKRLSKLSERGSKVMDGGTSIAD